MNDGINQNEIVSGLIFDFQKTWNENNFLYIITGLLPSSSRSTSRWAGHGNFAGTTVAVRNSSYVCSDGKKIEWQLVKL